MLKLLGIFTLACLSSMASSCIPSKGKKSSNTQSLDNFAAGARKTINDCKGNVESVSAWDGKIVIGTDIRAALSPEKQSLYISRVKQYLSSVPSEMQKNFLNFGGHILLTSEAKKECNATYSKAKDSDYYTKYESEGKNLADSCFVYAKGQEGTPDAGKDVAVIMHQINLDEVGVHSLAGNSAYDRNEERIMHAGVRSFGMMYAQYFAKLEVVDFKKGLRPHSGNFLLGNVDNSAMANLKEQLANRFIIDIALSEKAASGEKYSLDTLEPLLGVGSAELIRNSLFRNGSLKLEDLNKMSKDEIDGLRPLNAATFIYQNEGSSAQAEKNTRMNRFKDYVMGEGFDSLNCSDKSREILTAEFPKTKDLLGIANQAMIDFAKQLNDDPSGSNVNSSNATQLVTGAKMGLIEQTSPTGVSSTAAGTTTAATVNSNNWFSYMQIFSMFSNWGRQVGSMMAPMAQRYMAGAPYGTSTCANCQRLGCTPGNCSCASGTCQTSGGCLNGNCGASGGLMQYG